MFSLLFLIQTFVGETATPAPKTELAILKIVTQIQQIQIESSKLEQQRVMLNSQLEQLITKAQKDEGKEGCKIVIFPETKWICEDKQEKK